MSAKSWMPLYVADYLADTGHLTTVEHGAYLLLIMHYWQRGALPADDSRLAGIARLPLEQWLLIRATIAEFFGPGWKHSRIDDEKATAIERHQRRVNAGRKGGEAKAANGNATAEPVAEEQQSPTQPQPQPQPQKAKQFRPVAVRRSTYPEDFEAFWAAYPTDANMSKKEAAAAWAKLDPDDGKICLASVPAFVAYCKKNPDYRPLHACRYITQRRFDGFAAAQAAREVANVTEPIIALAVPSPEWEAACRALAAREGVAKFNSWIGLGRLVSAKPYRFEVPNGFIATQCKTFFEAFLEDQLGARVSFVAARPKAAE